MDNQLHNQIVNFIWGIADDCLRDVYVRGKYRDVILPMTVIRRLDAMLEDSKQKVLDMKKKLDDVGTGNHHAPLQHFSRETSTYIRQHRDEYVVMTQGGEVKLRRSLLQSRNIGAARESADIQYNMPEIFVD